MNAVKIAALIAAATALVPSAWAEEAKPAATAVKARSGQMLYAADGARIVTVNRVAADGAAQVILDGKLITIPADTLAVVDGKLTTTLSKSDLRRLK
jgi:hypothetical protein